MIARGLHHRLEGCGEHLLDEHVALRMRANVDHAYARVAMMPTIASKTESFSKRISSPK